MSCPLYPKDSSCHTPHSPPTICIPQASHTVAGCGASPEFPRPLSQMHAPPIPPQLAGAAGGPRALAEANAACRTGPRAPGGHARSATNNQPAPLTTECRRRAARTGGGVRTHACADVGGTAAQAGLPPATPCYPPPPSAWQAGLAARAPCGSRRPSGLCTGPKCCRALWQWRHCAGAAFGGVQPRPAALGPLHRPKTVHSYPYCLPKRLVDARPAKGRRPTLLVGVHVRPARRRTPTPCLPAHAAPDSAPPPTPPPPSAP